MPHAVQLFDGGSSRAREVSAFVRNGLAAGDRVVVVMRIGEWNTAAASLTRDDVALDEAIASGRLIVADAGAVLQQLLDDGVPDQGRFDAVIGELVARLTADGRPLRVYGEMVDLLAEAGDFAGAQRLEALWNALQARTRFTLFCGYASERFACAPGTAALRAIRNLHTHTHLHPDDVLGTHLMQSVST